MNVNTPPTRLERAGTWAVRLAKLGLGGFCGLYLLVVLLAYGFDSPSSMDWPLNLVLVGIAALTAAGALISRWLEAWALAASALSLAASLALFATSDDERLHLALLIEAAGLLVLIARVVWRGSRPWVVPVTAMLCCAFLAWQLRSWFSATTLVFTSAMDTVLVAAAIGVGLYLRALDHRRARALGDALRGERLDLARDLHDFVAHHVTGIVVQAQAARFAAGSGAAASPEQLDSMLASIEQAGTEALTAMRRLVGVLREATPEGQPETTEARPTSGLAEVEELVAAFADPPAKLSIALDIGKLSPEIAASVFRIVQESLTNVRKYAADATNVRVSVTRVPNGPLLEVAVRDDGRGHRRRLPTSGGYGLAGLAERVETLGGTIHAGSRPEGGWEVVAVLPLR